MECKAGASVWLEETCFKAAIKRGTKSSSGRKILGGGVEGAELEGRTGGKDTSSLLGDAAAC